MKINNFTTKDDYIQVLNLMLEPLGKYYSKGKSLLCIGYTGTHYGIKTAGLEGFSRVLWGLVPLWYGGKNSIADDWILEGIRNGTDPSHNEYWGDYEDGEQAYVEMAAIALAIWMTPWKVWNPLNYQEKENLVHWLNQINLHRISDNNWLFFRVLVNCAFKSIHVLFDEKILQDDLNRIDQFYLGDGWYSDGKSKQRDYYIGFAMHFYSLIYAKMMKKEDPDRCNKYIKRAKLFAADYIFLFGDHGEAVPFGRSQTYRFAQVGFFCALAFADVEAFPWGVIKGIINRHFRWWFSQPILDNENKLTLGYAYPNLAVCEGYNAPNSPYWSWKSLLILALDDDHPFWICSEEPIPKLNSVHVLEHPWMIIQREEGYVTALTSGQYAEWEPVHVAEKFEKFAYSSYFGFQTPRSYYGLSAAAPDNMLAFCRDGYYFVRRRCIKVYITEEPAICSEWEPMKGINVKTKIIPYGKGHIRKHIINSEFDCAAVEGGFSLGYEEPKEVKQNVSDNYAEAESTMGKSSIKLLEGNGNGKIVFCEANVNLLYPRTVLPCLEYIIRKGQTEISVYIEGIPGKDTAGWG